MAQVRQREDLLQRLPRATPAARTPVPTATARRSGSRACRSRARPGRRTAGRSSRRTRVSSASGLPVPVGVMSSGSSTGSCSFGTRHGAVRLAVDDRDRRAPRALARDREVVGLVADRRAWRRRRCRPSRSLSAVGLGGCERVRSRRGARRSPRRCGRPRGCRTRPSRRSARRRRARSAPAAAPPPQGPAACGRCRSAGSRRRRASCARRPPERSSSRRCAHCRRRAPRPRSAGASARSARSARRASASACGVKTVSRRAVGRGQVDLDAVDAAEHEALAGERDLVPAPAVGAARRRRASFSCT